LKYADITFNDFPFSKLLLATAKLSRVKSFIASTISAGLKITMAAPCRTLYPPLCFTPGVRIILKGVIS
jgi:hypothetical protein